MFFLATQPLFAADYSPLPPPCANNSINTGDNNCNSVNTGLGVPISTDGAGFVEGLFGILLGLSGGIATVLIIISGYKILASRGNPEKLQSAKQSLTSAIVGLLFIIFSFVILELIGVDILGIPGFER